MQLTNAIRYMYIVHVQLNMYSFIHSFIPDIYIVPLQETYSEAL